MRVNLFADSPLERWPSMDRYAYALFNALKRVAPEEDFRLLIPPAPPVNVPKRLFILWRMVVYPIWARRHSADVYHILDHSYGHLLFGLDGAHTVVTIHDLAPLVFYNNRWGLSSLAWRLSWLGTQRASWWITNSEFTRREALVRKPDLKARTITTWLGVGDHFRPLSREEKTRFLSQRGLEGKIVLHVGHCQPRKNVEALLKAVALLQRKDVHLIQVGGCFSSVHHQMVKELGLEGAVYQWEYVSEEDLVAFYNTADVFVLPSTYEGFGLPVLEAMACGTPVVAANAASLPEVVGDAGLLVDPKSPQALAEAIAQVLDNPTLAADLRQRGLERAQHFTWERTAEKTISIYRQVNPGNGYETL